MSTEVSTETTPGERLAAHRRIARLIARRRRVWARHAMMAAVSLGALAAFLRVARDVRRDLLTRFDDGVMHGLAGLRTAWLTDMVRDVTALGSPTLVTLVVALGCYRSRRRPVATAQIVLGVAGATLLNFLTKSHYERARPDVVPYLIPVPRSYSYPSGHALVVSAVYLSLALAAGRVTERKRVRAAYLTGAWAVGLAVAATRVYLGVHYPTDVIGGLALGTAWAFALDAAIDVWEARRGERGVLPPVVHPHPRHAHPVHGEERGSEGV